MMRIRLVPREEKYFEMFGAMAGRIEEAGVLLHRMFEDFPNRAKYADQIRGVERACDEIIHQIENQADQIYHEALGRLFQEEKDPIALIKWKEIYEILEKITDKTEDAANVLEAIVLKNQ